MVGASRLGPVGTVLPMGRTRPPRFRRFFPRRPAPLPVCPFEPLGVCVNLKKVLTWLAVAFVVWYVIQDPEGSAEMVRNAGNALGDAATSLSEFVGSLT